MTWREVAQQSAQIAAGCASLGLRSGDRVAAAASATASNSCWRCLLPRILALVTVLLSTRQQKPEIAYVLTTAAPGS